MKIKLYPDFEEVFIDNTLKGIFYPLCSYTIENQTFHFVSSNGLWMNEEFDTDTNTSQYTLFRMVDDKYDFNGDINLYTGAQEVKSLFAKLEEDFEKNGQLYLEKEQSTDDYIALQNDILPIQSCKELDTEYFLQTFYEYACNKLLATSNPSEVFGESPIVYTKETEEMEGTLNHFDQPSIPDFNHYNVIGKTIGYEFFSDGNDSLLFFNENTQQALTINFYS